MTTIKPAEKFARRFDVTQRAKIAQFFGALGNTRRRRPISGAV
jgi:hypothetical protein